MKIRDFDCQLHAFQHLTKRYEDGLVDETLYYAITMCVNIQGQLPVFGMDDGELEYTYPDDNTLLEFKGEFVDIKGSLH